VTIVKRTVNLDVALVAASLQKSHTHRLF
jgi:hypothetical protein